MADKTIDKITRNDALLLRDRLFEKTQSGELQTATANKYLSVIGMMVNVVKDNLRLGIDNPFSKLRLRERTKSTRPAYSADFIAEKLLNEDNLKGLNNQAKWLIFALADTGARPIELCNITAEQIYLDEHAPFIHIRENAHGTLKTLQSDRKIPLVGAALKAFRECPEGFPRYREKHDNAPVLLISTSARMA